MTRRTQSVFPLLLLAVALSSPAVFAARAPKVGDQVSDFTFSDFGGAEHHLSEFSGKYVLLDFWATWCPPCIKEIPDLKQAREKFQARGLVIIGMNSDKQQEKAEKFVQENDIPWLQSPDSSTRQVLHRALKVKWYPTMILIGPQGKILAVSNGETPPLYGPSLHKTLDETLPPAGGGS